MRVVFFGTPQFAVPTLEKLLTQTDIEVVGVVTQPDKKRGRGNQLVPSPIKTIAIAHKLPIWQPARIKKDPDTIEALRSLAADVFVVIAYGQILSQEILDLPRLGCINVHGSILPEYRGAAPIQRCLTNGVTSTGITTMLMDVGMDTGAMLLTVETPVTLWDNAHTLAIRLATMGADLLIDTLNQLPDLTPIPQDDHLATYAPPIQKSEYQIDWTRSSIDIHNQIRGFYPNCTTTFRDQPLKILATTPIAAVYRSQLPPEIQKIQPEIENLSSPHSPGTIVYLAKNLGPVIASGDGYLLLQEVQLPGKKPQSGSDMVNGSRLEIGEIFSSC
jgi:methionyl-tRNA formyltransferase